MSTLSLLAAPVTELVSTEQFLERVKPLQDVARLRRDKADAIQRLIDSDHRDLILEWSERYRGQKRAAAAATAMLDNIRDWILLDGIEAALEYWLVIPRAEVSVWPRAWSEVETETGCSRRFVRLAMTDKPTFRQTGRAPCGYDGRYIALVCATVHSLLGLPSPLTKTHVIAFFDIIHGMMSRISALQEDTIAHMGNRKSEPEPTEAIPAVLSSLDEPVALEAIVNQLLSLLSEREKRDPYADQRFSAQFRQLLTLVYMQSVHQKQPSSTLFQESCRELKAMLGDFALATPRKNAAPAHEQLAHELLELSVITTAPDMPGTLEQRTLLSRNLYAFSERVRMIPNENVTIGALIDTLQ